jgi:penicillin-binding protein 2
MAVRMFDGAIPNRRIELETVRRRLLLTAFLALIALLVLALRYAWLQLVEEEAHRARAENNRLRFQPLPPPRGLIYDRRGRLLADNTLAYRLEIIPERVPDLERTLAELRSFLPIGEEEIERFRHERALRRAFQSVPILFRLSEEEVAAFAVRRHRLPGVELVPYLTRNYPYGATLSHAVGYVGRIDERDLERLDRRRYIASTHVGKAGLERHYEDWLHGEAGYERVEVNAVGRILRVLERRPAVPGRSLVLSLDAALQEAAVAAFAGARGAAIALDPRSGEVLLLLSLPGYDPNDFVRGMRVGEYRRLLEHPDRPLYNRAVQGLYEPGSTIKPFLALAALAHGMRDPSRRYLSTGEFRLPGQSQGYRDWRKGGHGWVDMNDAIAESVNSYFYALASDLGIDRMSDYLGRFGFGQPTGIDVPGESAGVLPSRAWKRERSREPWYPGETVIAGIGQGYWQVTPIQLAHATALLAARGQGFRPHLVRSHRDAFGRGERVAAEPWPSWDIDENDWRVVAEGMVAVVHGPRGTARAIAAELPFRVAGKTGTAQRVRSPRREEERRDMPERLRHNALFVAFAPAERPEIALAVLVEAGESGARAAAPVAREILRAWWDLRER